MRWAMAVSLQERWRNEDISKEAEVVSIGVTTGRRTLDMFVRMKRRSESGDVRAVV